MSGSGGRVHLLDVNVLVALFDPGHIHHEAAHRWFGSTGCQAWATCPLTENGFVRVLSNPGYAGRRTTVRDAAERLRAFTDAAEHSFWPDAVSLLDPSRIEPRALHGYREITDVYLLALAVERGGTLATFDTGVRADAARGAKPEHLVVLER